MKLEMRFAHKAPEETADVWRFKITHGELEVEVATSGAGLMIRLNQPFGDQLVVFPQASNGITIRAGHE